jgi:tetratricopeptide (TPR) repeat protein
LSQKSKRGFQPTEQSGQFKRLLSEASEHQRRARYQEALTCYRQLLMLKPADTILQTKLAHMLEQLGNSYYDQGRPDIALPLFKELITVDPKREAAHLHLGLVFKSLNQLDQAIIHYQQALTIAPNDIHAICNLGLAYRGLGQPDEAERWYRQALVIQPDSVEAIACLSDIQEWRGNYLAAYDLLKPCLDRLNANATIVFATVCLRQRTPEEAKPLVLQCLKRQDLTFQERTHLLFKLGDLHDMLGDFDAAFDSYKQANVLSRQPFEPDYWIQETSQVIATFGETMLEKFPRTHVQSQLPIFIVGMPRSGTSLVEQILGSHPSVFAAGELPDLAALASRVPIALTQSWLDETAQAYLARLQNLSPQARYITDKQPTNYLYLWLVALVFPGARIIHCTRDPFDTCLSCYFQNFNARQRYAGELQHLGIVYRQYERLMTHWQHVLDLQMISVRYEDLVADLESTSRQILNFLELEWHPDCLAFYQNKRIVNTASYDQVRRPIYNDSIGRAQRNYGHHLDSLARTLGRTI